MATLEAIVLMKVLTDMDRVLMNSRQLPTRAEVAVWRAELELLRTGPVTTATATPGRP